MKQRVNQSVRNRALINAAKEGNFEKVSTSLRDGASIHYTKSDKKSALFLASAGNHLIAAYLLATNTNFDPSLDERGSQKYEELVQQRGGRDGFIQTVTFQMDFATKTQAEKEQIIRNASKLLKMLDEKDSQEEQKPQKAELIKELQRTLKTRDSQRTI